MTDLIACPCCGYATIGSRNNYEICSVCWWEDEGLDNRFALDYSPPNRTNLNLARFHFLTEGISKPSRTDLKNHQEPRENFARLRFFEASADGLDIIERDSTNTQIIYQGTIPFVDYEDAGDWDQKVTKIQVPASKPKWSLKK